jgi:hypothetical protein
MDRIVINIVEVASELAHNKLLDVLFLNNESEADEILYKNDGDTLVYKEEYQDMFNEYYDYFYTIINKLKLND